MITKASDITRTLRLIVPHPVHLVTRGTGPGEFTLTMPANTARHMGFGRDDQYAAQWLSRNLRQQVRIEAVEFPRRRSWSHGPRAVITLRI